MTETEQREALEALTHSPGWALYVDLASTEWARKRDAGQRNCLTDVDDIRALNKLRQVAAADDAVKWCLELPEKMAKQLKAQENGAPPLATRRDDRDVLVGAMSRRGGL